MKVSDVEKRLEAIRERAGDPEVAHGREDDMFIAVLEAISRAKSLTTARQLAAAALKSREIKFARWCA